MLQPENFFQKYIRYLYDVLPTVFSNFLLKSNTVIFFILLLPWFSKCAPGNDGVPQKHVMYSSMRKMNSGRWASMKDCLFIITHFPSNAQLWKCWMCLRMHTGVCMGQWQALSHLVGTWPEMVIGPHLTIFCNAQTYRDSFANIYVKKKLSWN